MYIFRQVDFPKYQCVNFTYLKKKKNVTLESKRIVYVSVHTVAPGNEIKEFVKNVFVLGGVLCMKAHYSKTKPKKSKHMRLGMIKYINFSLVSHKWFIHKCIFSSGIEM